MIRYKTGDILSEDTEALVNTVNCVGIMGRGIALQFKRAYPDNFKAYAARCKRKEMRPGRVFVFDTHATVNPRFIINFPTKRHWRGKSRIEDIESGLTSLVREIRLRGIRSIAVPPLGSGLGGLNWPGVRARIEAALEVLDDVEVVIFEPGGGPAHNSVKPVGDLPRMTPGRAALIGLLDKYLLGLLDPFVTLLEAHKLMYFMQVAGEPLRLKFTKGHYGPYAENLRHVLNAIEGHFVTGYEDGGDAPDKELELVPSAVEAARAFLAEKAITRGRFERVAGLVDGFESPFGLELLATVHWVATALGARTPDEAVARTYAWNARKRRFSRRQIGLAFTLLTERGWVPTAPDGARRS